MMAPVSRLRGSVNVHPSLVAAVGALVCGSALAVGPGRTLAAPDDGQHRVVLFIHGAGTPAEVAFDTPREDYEN